MSYDRQRYIEALKKQLEPNIFNHSLCVEACMDGIYEYLKQRGDISQDEPAKEDWLLAGLIHDIDFSGEFKENHPNHTLDALKKHGLEISPTVHELVLAHDKRQWKTDPQFKAHWAIFCADSLTGLIVAVALIIPSKKLNDVKLKSIIKRFKKQPKFAAGTRRDEVIMCEREDGLNIEIDKFIEICFESMKKIATEIGL